MTQCSRSCVISKRCCSAATYPCVLYQSVSEDTNSPPYIELLPPQHWSGNWNTLPLLIFARFLCLRSLLSIFSVLTLTFSQMIYFFPFVPPCRLWFSLWYQHQSFHFFAELISGCSSFLPLHTARTAAIASLLLVVQICTHANIDNCAGTSLLFKRLHFFNICFEFLCWEKKTWIAVSGEYLRQFFFRYFCIWS